MIPPLADIRAYSAFVYGVAGRHDFVMQSNLVLAPVGATLAKLEGSIWCAKQVRVEVWELVDFAQAKIRAYSYEIYRAEEKVCWFDPWPHPEVPALAANFPHHKHLPPDLRHHRVPAPGISFVTPNLDVVLLDAKQQWIDPA